MIDIVGVNLIFVEGGIGVGHEVEDVQLVVILFADRLLSILHELRPCHFQLHLLILQLEILEAFAILAVLAVFYDMLERWRQLREKILR